jgi:hypothetical protein
VTINIIMSKAKRREFAIAHEIRSMNPRGGHPVAALFR